MMYVNPEILLGVGAALRTAILGLGVPVVMVTGWLDKLVQLGLAF